MFKKIICAFCALVCLCFFWTQNARPLFSGYSDTFELYLESPSSISKIVSVNENDFASFKNIKGESCFIRDGKTTAKDLLEKYNAVVVFTETVNGTVNYYAYSNEIKYKATLNGKLINLHVSVSSEYLVAGAPMIFGSF